MVLQTLATITAIEMPARHVFDESLIRFVGGLAPELRETATFIPDVYAEVAHAVAQGLVAELSPRLQLWATCHHARSGSRKQNLILLPRDAYYDMESVHEESLRASYAALTDGEPVPSKPEDAATGPLAALDPLAVFDRVPVQPQIYDILVYTHRNHSSASSMLAETRRIGIVSSSELAPRVATHFVPQATITWPMVEIFTRLCPHCKIRGKNNNARVATDEEQTPSASRAPSHISKR